MKLDLPTPYHVEGILDFLSVRSITGVEHFDGRDYVRIVPLAGGPGVLRLHIGDDAVDLEVELTDPTDLDDAVVRVRRLLDLDSDPAVIDAALSEDPLLAGLVADVPGLRLPGAVDPFEAAIRAIVGQQVSVAGARTVLGRIAARYGEPVDHPLAAAHGLERAFPTPEALASADEADFSMPRARARTIIDLSRALVHGDLVLEATPNLRRQLLAMRGIGPWTADYIRMRALSDPDVMLETDLVMARILARDAITTERIETWAPWRTYATLHLWRTA